MSYGPRLLNGRMSNGGFMHVQLVGITCAGMCDRGVMLVHSHASVDRVGAQIVPVT